MAMATATATITTTTVTAVHQDDIELERLDSGPSPATSPPDASTSLEGWLVLASCTTIFFVTLGLVYSFGVMQAVLISRKYASASTLGWVSSLVVVCVSGLALPCTAVVAHLGSRNTALIAGIMIGASQLATSFAFAAPVWTLFLAQGFFGIAYALAYWSTNALAAQYFERRRGLALGIVYAGSGIGGAVFSIALSQLERRYGLEWAVRIFAFLGWVTLLPAALAVKEKFRPTMKTFAWRYFKDTTFDLIFFATALSSFSLFVPPFFWPTFASAAGLSPSVGAYLVAGEYPRENIDPGARSARKIDPALCCNRLQSRIGCWSYWLWHAFRLSRTRQLAHPRNVPHGIDNFRSLDDSRI